MRRLTVLNIAFPFATAGRDAVGGAEQILNSLDEALVTGGHRSIVVAAEGSNVCGTLIPTAVPPGQITDEVRATVHANHLANIHTAIESYRPDLIHMHGIDFHCYLPPAGVPVLVTLHLPPAWYPQSIWELDRPHTYLHCVSSTQQKQCPPGVQLLQPIPNGVPIELLRYHCTRRRYAIALGRICPEKNFHVAMDAAKAAGIPLLIGGQTFPYETHELYFRKEIEPRLNGRTRFLGPLAFERKRRLLSGAQCLISASLAAETSSLVTMESLACGTPVVALPSGALPEIVEDGVTGFLVSNEREMAEAIGRCPAIDPKVCREAARRRFSLRTMVDQYFDVYRGLAQDNISVAGLPRPELITTDTDLRRLETEWHRLWLEDEHATVFQSPSWLLPWWKHIGQGELLTPSLRVGPGRRLVGLLPLYIYTQSSGSRDLFPLGIATSDYHDQLAAPGYSALLAERSLAALLAHGERWDVIDLQQIRGSSPLLNTATPSGLCDRRMESEACPVLTLPDSLEALTAVLPWNVRHNLMYYRARARRLGRFQVDAVDERSVEEAYEALIHLHHARWSQRQESGVLADPAVQLAHRETIPALLGDDCLRMYVMRIDGRIAAVFYGLADPAGREGRAVYYYLSGFEPQYKSLSPGTILIGHAIEQAVRERFTCFDFLRGREPYKYLWGAVDRPTYRRLIRSAAAALPTGSNQEVLR